MPAPGDQHRDTKASINPFEEQPTRVSEFTAAEIATLQSRLDKQLGPEYISTRPGAGGGKVHYLAAEKVINLANEVFGFNGWSSAIQNVQVDFVDENPTSGKITLGLSTVVRVTLRDGTFHEDVGYGHIENCKGKAAAFEKAKKESVTDALKRALRNFGNVLGNCLYDKDYLQRVTKVKVVPSRWDSDNLHRHPDYAPIKKELAAEAGAGVMQQNRPIRTESAQSAQSNGTEFGEDEFGGNLFDEMDFGHPDEVHLDGSTIESGPATPRTNGSVAATIGQSLTRTNSMPNVRQQDVRPPQRAIEPARSGVPGAMAPQTNGGMGPPPQVLNGSVSQQKAVMQRQDGHQGASSLATSAPDAAQTNGVSVAPSAKSGNDKNLTPPEEQGRQPPNDPPMPSEVPPGAPAGFVRLLAAEEPVGKPFDPHADSPSMRRTGGVNQAKSEPIKRSTIGGPGQQMVVARPGVPNGAPNGRPNFVNPAADMNRRIGAPGGGMHSPMGNRGAYKPPSAVKRPAPADIQTVRPPLADMSNNQQPEGQAEAKKLKIEDVKPQNEQNEPTRT